MPDSRKKTVQNVIYNALARPFGISYITKRIRIESYYIKKMLDQAIANHKHLRDDNSLV